MEEDGPGWKARAAERTAWGFRRLHVVGFFSGCRFSIRPTRVRRFRANRKPPSFA